MTDKINSTAQENSATGGSPWKVGGWSCLSAFFLAMSIGTGTLGYGMYQEEVSKFDIITQKVENNTLHLDQDYRRDFRVNSSCVECKDNPEVYKEPERLEMYINNNKPSPWATFSTPFCFAIMTLCAGGLANSHRKIKSASAPK